MRSNRGEANLAFALLVILGIFLIFMAWISFLSFNNSMKNYFVESYNLMQQRDVAHENVKAIALRAFNESVNLKGEEGVLQVSSEFKSRVMIYEEISVKGRGNFFGKIRNDDFKIVRNGNLYILEVGDLFVETSDGVSRFRRNFAINYEIESKENKETIN